MQEFLDYTVEIIGNLDKRWYKDVYYSNDIFDNFLFQRLRTIEATYTQTDITVLGYGSTCTAKANSTPGSRLK